MEIDRIKLIRQYNPDMKIILILRNPVERVWSQATMNFLKFNAFPYEGNEKYYKRFIFSPGIVDLGKYYNHILKWGKVFSPNQILIQLYDDFEYPSQFLKKIVIFLGLEENVFRV